MMKRLIFLTFISLVSGCVVGPDYKPPVMPTPKQWSIDTHQQSNADLASWWQSFHDPLLNQLIQESISANLDLKVAILRIINAKALRTETLAAGLPSINARNMTSRRLNNTSANQNQSGGGSFGVGNQLINILQLGFDAQWELDFFGGIQRAIEASDANIDFEIENSRDVSVSLLAEVARNYLELRYYQQLIALTEANIKTQQDTLNLTASRQQAGLNSYLEVSQQQAQLAATQARLPDYEKGVKQSIHALSLLLAKPPDYLSARLNNPAPIPSQAKLIGTYLPSELLQRRPDIRKAERSIAVANAEIGIATSALYPKFNIAAFIGLQNTRITDFTLLGKSWSMAGTLTAPIFNWGKLNAEIKSKRSQYEQAYLNYENTVLTAFKEVEDALVAEQSEQQRFKILGEAVSANQLALDLANERYIKGLSDFLNVLNSQQAVFTSQSNKLDSELNMNIQLVVLYKAMGGGWQTIASVNAICDHGKDSNVFQQVIGFIKSDCRTK